MNKIMVSVLLSLMSPACAKKGVPVKLPGTHVSEEPGDSCKAVTSCELQAYLDALPQPPPGKDGKDGESITGPKGDKGDSVTGPTGAQGLTGNAGSPGQTGSIGPQGPQGLQGLTGPKGDTGSAGPGGGTSNTSLLSATRTYNPTTDYLGTTTINTSATFVPAVLQVIAGNQNTGAAYVYFGLTKCSYIGNNKSLSALGLYTFQSCQDAQGIAVSTMTPGQPFAFQGTITVQVGDGAGTDSPTQVVAFLQIQ